MADAAAPRFVIGTAGHIDHGKTSLVRALTGVDLDALPEEKARGITIALGFTHTELPGGRVVSFIDVPGHEKLVRTMVAGASGFDAALLCVSAVEGVMPQTREHIAILDLLGVRRGVVALTMCDLVDAEMRALARLDVEEALAGTGLAGVEVVETAAGPAPQGLDALRAALAALPDAARAATGPFWLPVDRCFVQRGFGTIVTGTVRDGTLADGDEVRVLPAGLKARVRGIEVHGARVGGTRAGWRTALNLAGVERDDLARGQVIVRAGELEPTAIADVRVRALGSAPPLESGVRVRVLAGTAEEMGVLDLLGEDALWPSGQALAQLRLDAPMVLPEGEPFILRRESPVETLGGGRVLDPAAPRARRRDHARVRAELLSLEAGDRGVLLERAGDAGVSAAEARRRGLAGEALGDRVLAPARVAALEAVFVGALGAWHAENPLASGAPRRALHRGSLAALSERAYDALIARAVAAGVAVVDGPRVRLPGFAVRLSAAEQGRQDALRAAVQAAGLEGPDWAALAAAEPALLQLLLEAGAVQKVGEHALSREALDGLVGAVRGWFGAHDTLTPADFKELSGLSRRHAIPLLEWLDAQRVTLRDGDLRRLRPPDGPRI